MSTWGVTVHGPATYTDVLDRMWALAREGQDFEILWNGFPVTSGFSFTSASEDTAQSLRTLDGVAVERQD